MNYYCEWSEYSEKNAKAHGVSFNDNRKGY
jgi:hypothetical protein